MKSKRSYPKFKPQSKAAWIGELRQKVQQWVTTNDKRVKNGMHTKAGLMVLCYLFAYIGLLFFSPQLWTMFAWYMLLGACLIILFLNTAHDIAHSTFFRSPKLNQLFLFVFDILGDDHTIWKTRHVNFHHSYSNIQGWDKDIRQTKLVSHSSGCHLPTVSPLPARLYAISIPVLYNPCQLLPGFL